MFLDVILESAHTWNLFGTVDIVGRRGHAFKAGTYLLINEKTQRKIANKFPHKRFASVHRSFNMYGFVKSQSRDGAVIFYHPQFHKDVTTDDLAHIKTTKMLSRDGKTVLQRLEKLEHGKDKDPLLARVERLEQRFEEMEGRLLDLEIHKNLDLEIRKNLDIPTKTSEDDLEEAICQRLEELERTVRQIQHAGQPLFMFSTGE